MNWRTLKDPRRPRGGRKPLVLEVRGFRWMERASCCRKNAKKKRTTPASDRSRNSFVFSRTKICECTHTRLHIFFFFFFFFLFSLARYMDRWISASTASLLPLENTEEPRKSKMKKENWEIGRRWKANSLVRGAASSFNFARSRPCDCRDNWRRVFQQPHHF